MPLKYFFAAFLSLVMIRVRACTIFVLTDSEHALFCNNEDWSSPRTRIWFVPNAPSQFGCAYVGFDDNWAQGGLNTEGLAFDWVAGYREEWTRKPNMVSVKGNPSELLLQKCTTVDEAIAFYKSHWEPSFSIARILVADRSGVSVIIGAHAGLLTVERDNKCRGFGFGHPVLTKMLAENSRPTLSNAAAILKAARQPGRSATKYSNVYDLKSRDIFLFSFPSRDDMVSFNLNQELKKGGHFYEMPKFMSNFYKAQFRSVRWVLCQTKLVRQSISVDGDATEGEPDLVLPESRHVFRNGYPFRFAGTPHSLT